MSQNEDEKVLDIVRKHENKATQLLQILREIQDQFRHIPQSASHLIAKELNVAQTQVQSVTEFYSLLSSKPQGRFHILISDSISDHMLGSRELADALCQKLNIAIGETRADGRVSIDFTSCTGLCDQGPAGLINGLSFSHLSLSRIDQIVDSIEKELPLEQWPAELFEVKDNIQKPGLLLSQAIEKGSALKQAMQRGFSETLAEIETSGLRGRGGAGFQTASKWQMCMESPGDHYVVCNADEGEPGTFKDRVLLQSYAHQVFEGMTIAAGIIKAKSGFLYLRGEYLYLFDSLQKILEERRQQNLLGKNILGQDGFDFDIQIHLGAGAYICGEESALIESLEGKRGVPRIRPPFPVSSGYLNQPTIVNNVETFASAARISLEGGGWFAAHGTEKSKGSKILSICGDCARPGIYEYDFGVSISQILNDCGASNTLGIQVGGPSGTFIGTKELDRKLAFEDLATGGSFMIFNQTRNVLEIARNFTHFFAHESCGFCTPCRVGTSLLKNNIDKICEGHGAAIDLTQLALIGKLIKKSSHCGLGQTAAHPILTTLERFPEVYQARLKNIDFEPGFDLDGALEIARRLSGRDDVNAHLQQEEA